jgi:hypothetical protein
MNPYLENPEFWTEVHHLLIGILAETLNPQLLPAYRAAIEQRIYQLDGEDALFVGIPDASVERTQTTARSAPSNLAVAPPPNVAPSTPTSVTIPLPMEIRESYLEVRSVATREVITVIELLSPSNKRSGRGRDTYHDKRQAVLGSRTHLVEIDLLSSGEPMPCSAPANPGSYRILISRGDLRPQADLYRFNLPDPIPIFPLPLPAGSTEPVIDLHVLLDQVYDRAGYPVVIQYQDEPTSTLSPSDRAWLDGVLRSQRLR